MNVVFFFFFVSIFCFGARTTEYECWFYTLTCKIQDGNRVLYANVNFHVPGTVKLKPTQSLQLHKGPVLFWVPKLYSILMPTTMNLFVLTLVVCHRMNLNKWDLLPQMTNSVLEPQAFFLCGKLYYFSGHEENKPRAMAYKPTLNTWESLLNPQTFPVLRIVIYSQQLTVILLISKS